MRILHSLSIATALLSVQACSSSDARPTAPLPQGAVRVADCTGPAVSLPQSLAALLPPRTGNMQPDDQWADLAATVPGGFAGVWYDGQHEPILMLTRPGEETAARAALATQLSFPIKDATVHAARWDFLQLVDWFNYIMPRLTVGIQGADKDEVLNRISLSVRTPVARDSMVAALNALHLPCDLVIVDLSGMTMETQ